MGHYTGVNDRWARATRHLAGREADRSHIRESASYASARASVVDAMRETYLMSEAELRSKNGRYVIFEAAVKAGTEDAWERALLRQEQAVIFREARKQ